MDQQVLQFKVAQLRNKFSIVINMTVQPCNEPQSYKSNKLTAPSQSSADALMGLKLHAVRNGAKETADQRTKA